MGVKLVDVANDGNSGVVTLESDNSDHAKAIMELQNGATKNLALKEAAKAGIPDPRCNGLRSSPYAIDAEGKVVTNPAEQTVSCYRIDVSVTAKIG